MMKRLLFVLIIVLTTSLRAGCYDCGCNPAGTVGGEEITAINWPTEPIKRSYCCGSGGSGTTITASAFVQNLPELANLYIHDSDLYMQDEWKQVWDDTWVCHCELTSKTAFSFNDPVAMEWSGEINTCTTGIQTLSLYVYNTTISLTQVGGWMCGEKKNGGCVNSEPCTNTVAMSEMESKTLTLQVDVEVKNECGNGCGMCETTAKYCTVCANECSNQNGECLPDAECFSGAGQTCSYTEYTYDCDGGACCVETSMPIVIYKECRSGRFGTCLTCQDRGFIQTMAEVLKCPGSVEPIEDCNY